MVITHPWAVCQSALVKEAERAATHTRGMAGPKIMALGDITVSRYSTAMQIGIDSFVATRKDPVTGVAPSPAQRIRDLLEEIEHADQAGVDAFGVGEHHRADFADSAPAVILAAGAARTKKIRLAS